MFMINYELVYGKGKFSSNVSNTSYAEYSSAPVIQPEVNNTAESSKTGFTQSAVGFMPSENIKRKLGSSADKLKNAAGAVAQTASGVAKSAVETAKSEETAAKLALLKEKSQSVAGKIGASVSEVGHKISENTVTPNNDFAIGEPNISAEIPKASPVYNEPPREVVHSQSVYAKSQDNTYSNAYSQANSAPTPKKSSAKPVLIGIGAGLGVCAVFAFGLFGGMYLMNNKSDVQNSKSDKVAEVSASEESSESESESKNESLAENSEDENELPEAEIVFSDISYDEDSIYSAYIEIVNGMDFTVPMCGFMTDMNDDGIDELIIPEDGQYMIYYYSDGDIKAYTFGSYADLGGIVMYKVDGDNGNKYIYYRDEYSYMSLQGYFSLDTKNQLNIFIDYPYDDNNNYYADWKITYNYSEEFETGYESVSTFYAQPNDCHNALLDSFNHYNLDISENSSYSKIENLYYDELAEKLKKTEVNTSQSSFSTDINDYPLYLARLQWIASTINMGYDYYDYMNLDLCVNYSGWDVSLVGYMFQDLNADGFPELIIGTADESICEVYTVRNDQLVMLCQSAERYGYWLCENNIIGESGSGGASSGGKSYYIYNGGNELEEISSLEYVYTVDGECLYYLDGCQISASEADNLVNIYTPACLWLTPLSTVLQ